MDAEGTSNVSYLINRLSVLVLNEAGEGLNLLKHIEEIQHKCDRNSKISENYDKLQNDREYAESIVKKTLLEMIDTNSFNIIKDFIIEEINKKNNDEKILEEAEAEMRKLVCIKKQLKQCDEEWYYANKEKEELLGSIKDEYENVAMEFGIKENYVTKWQNSQIEQNRLKIKMKENLIEEILRKNKDAIENELRVNMEVAMYFSYVIAGIENKIEYWRHRYESELNSMNEKINSIQDEKLFIKTRIDEIIALYNLRDEEMKNYQLLKEEKRLQEEEKARLNAKAIIIQAWWRGVMVRRKLGPYKPKKSRGKGKKQKKL